MMARLELWEVFEADVQDAWGLSATLNSGNKFWDSGDAVDHRVDSPWPMWVDAKHTTKKAFPVQREEILALHHRAAMLGKRFVLAVRFRHPVARHSARERDSDYVLVPREDYEELLVKVGVL